MGHMLGNCKHTCEAIQTYSWTGVMCLLLHLTGARPLVQHGKLWHSQMHGVALVHACRWFSTT